jgi:hypothetical protein
MASNKDLSKQAEVAPEVESTEEPATSVPEIKKEEESRESRLTRIFKEKLSALDFLDLQAFIMDKKTEKVAHVEPEVTTPAPEAKVETKVETPAPEAKVEAAVEPKIKLRLNQRLPKLRRRRK